MKFYKKIEAFQGVEVIGDPNTLNGKFYGTQVTPTATTGTTPGNLPLGFDALGATGQDFSSTDASSTAQDGASQRLQAGAGGAHSGIPASGFTKGGAGGTVTNQAGAGGAGTAASGDNRGGIGGSMNFGSGNGGASTVGQGGDGGTMTHATRAGGNGATTGGAGGLLRFFTGNGGNGVTGGPCGAFTVSLGTGGTGTTTPGAGGLFSVNAGKGGICNGAGVSGTGGAANITAGAGGNNSNAAGTAGNGGDLGLDAGAAGTPSGGAASGSPGVVNVGATNASAINLGKSGGAVNFAAPALPSTDDGVALGSTTKEWSDLFLASGAVINFASGNATLTHSSGKITSNVPIAIPLDTYGAGWATKPEAASKQDVYTKIETLSAGSGITRSIVSTSGNVTMGATASVDYVYLVTGAHTITCPTAVSNTNRYTVKNNHSANITVNTTSSQTIDGATSLSLGPGESIDLISNNANWSIL